MKTQATITDPEIPIPHPLDLTCPDRINSALDLSWLADCQQHESDSMREAMSALARISEFPISSNSISSEMPTHMQRLEESILPSIDLCRASAAVSHRLGPDPIGDAGERRRFVQEGEMSGHIDIGRQEGSSVRDSTSSLATRGPECNHKV